MTGPLAGAVELPDGTWIRGRGIRGPTPTGPDPDFGVYLGVDFTPGWAHERIDWPDFRLPRDSRSAAVSLRRAYELARTGSRVEVACRGGRGRTGTALAAISILAGVPPEHAVAWVRGHYDRHAVETVWQRRWVRRFPSLLT